VASTVECEKDSRLALVVEDNSLAATAEWKRMHGQVGRYSSVEVSASQQVDCMGTQNEASYDKSQLEYHSENLSRTDASCLLTAEADHDHDDEFHAL